MHTQWRQNTRQQCNRQVMSEDGGPVRGSKHFRRKKWEGVRSHTSFSDVYQWIHLQQITPGWNVFFSNSHQWLVTSLRGSAQILQQTEQCSASLGYISPSVLQYASYWNTNCPLAPASVHVHHRRAHFPPLHIWDFVRTDKETDTNKSHDQVLYRAVWYSEPVTENSLNTVCSVLWKLV